jgi:5-carboxymethyl-2-hydroxymuconate isomerase
MPHLVILYTPNLDTKTDMTVLCRTLADTMLAQRDDAGQPVFPRGGTRVLAYPAAHYAVADGGEAGRAAGGSGEYAFIYLNVRMAAGRSQAVKEKVGESILSSAKIHLAPVFARHHIGMTVQVDEGAQAYDGKHSTLHPLFQK